MMRRFARWMLIALLATALGVGPLSSVVHAASIVTSLADDGSSGTLRSVIAAAAPGDTITFQPELTGTILLDTSLGALNLTKNVIIQGPGASIIAVDSRCPTCGAGGMPSGGITVFTLTITMASATISGLTIQHGNGDSCCGTGGIQSFGTLLTVADCTVSGNSGGGVASYGPLIVTGSTIAGNATAGDGGGIWSDRSTLTVANSTITGNSASGVNSLDGGGGLYNSSTAMLTNTTVKGNTATRLGGGILGINAALTMTGGTIGGPNAPDGNRSGASGGGLYFTVGSGVTAALSLNGVTVSHNTANDPASSSGGGGIINYGLYDGTNTSITTITNSAITGNTADDMGPTDHGNGGGIANFNGTMNIVNSTIAGNTARGGSGGIGGGINNGAFLNVTGSTISGNSAINGTGSGVSTKNNVGGQLPTTATITNSTIVGNMATGTGATGLGGGIYHKYDSGTNFKSTVQLTYTTIARNTASTGGGVRNEDALQSLGTIIAANSGGDCSILAPGAITSQGYNLDDDGSCSLTMPTDRPNDANPGLAPALAANGSAGPQTLALIAGSDAIDHGGTSANGCPTTDERGITRPQGAACGIGAFEAPATLTPRPAPPPRPGPPPSGGPPRPIPTPRPGPSPSGGPPLPLPILRQ